jgi:hypothetical protein
MNSLFQFDDETTPAPTLRLFVEAGDLSGAAKFVEALSIDAAIEAVLRAGFSVMGGKKDKKLFYEFFGKQLIKSCEKKQLPIDEPDSTLLF